MILKAKCNSKSVFIVYMMLSIFFNLTESRPNVIILLADDLGYGDLASWGHPTSVSPTLDMMTRSGRTFSHFYSTSPICSPSRASLLTGRYQVRSGIYPGTFVPESVLGLPRNETTIAQILKNEGYTTSMVGKWHLGVGDEGEFLPTNFGFESYLGIPYSHDMCPCPTCFPHQGPCLESCWEDRVSCPLYRNATIIEQPTPLVNLSKVLQNEATSFIEEAHAEDKPFFLYYSTHHIHHPQFANAPAYTSTSRGPTGDALKEADAAISNLLRTLERLGILNETIVWVSSDNGPSLMRHERGGSAGPLRCGKGTTWEGGIRVPSILYWQGHIQPGRTEVLSSMMDILPSICSLLGIDVTNRTLDGIDLSPVIIDHNAKGPRDFLAVYPTDPSQDIGPLTVIYKGFKSHFYTKGNALSDNENYDHFCRDSHHLTKHDPPLLYNLHQDPSERYSLDSDEENAMIRKNITAWRDQHMASITYMSARTNVINNRSQPCCTNRSCNPFPQCCDCNSQHYLKPWLLSNTYHKFSPSNSIWSHWIM